MAPFITDTWIYWADATASTSISSGQVWTTWVSNTTTSFNDNTWEYWHQMSGTGSGLLNPGQYMPAVVSEEEIEARRAQVAERLARADSAKEAARQLLLEVLDDDQQAELVADGHFHVHTRDGVRTYRLRPGYPPVRVKGEDGYQHSYCIHPVEQYPADDTAAALKLLIETDEDRFLRIANASRVGPVAVAA